MAGLHKLVICWIYVGFMPQRQVLWLNGQKLRIHITSMTDRVSFSLRDFACKVDMTWWNVCRNDNPSYRYVYVCLICTIIHIIYICIYIHNSYIYVHNDIVLSMTIAKRWTRCLNHGALAWLATAQDYLPAKNLAKLATTTKSWWQMLTEGGDRRATPLTLW